MFPISLIPSLKRKLSDYAFELAVLTIKEIKDRFSGINIHQRHNNGEATMEAAMAIKKGFKALRLMVVAIVKHGNDTIIDGWHFAENVAENEHFLTVIYHVQNSQKVRELMGIHNNNVQPTQSWKLYTNPQYSKALDQLRKGTCVKIAEKKSINAGVIDYRDALRILVNFQTGRDGGKKEFNEQRPAKTTINQLCVALNQLQRMLNDYIAPESHRLFLRGPCLSAWASYYRLNWEGKSRVEFSGKFLSHNQLAITAELNKRKRLPGSVIYSFWKYIFSHCFERSKDVGTYGRLLESKGCFITEEVK